MIMRIFVIFLSFCCIFQQAKSQSEILRKILNFDRSNISISEDCANDLENIKNDLSNHEIWALKLMDISGRPTSGFIWGNNYWLGSQRACWLLNNPPKIYMTPSVTRRSMENITDIGSPIRVNYRMFYANHHSKLQFDADIFNKSILHIGVCMPLTCNDYDSYAIAKNILKQDQFPDLPMLNELAIISTKVLKVRDHFVNETFVITMLAIFLVSILLSIFGTLYVKSLKRYRANWMKSKFNNNQDFDIENFEAKFKETWFEKLMSCFSLHENMTFLASTNIGKKSIPPIHGIRAIAMLWIMVGHVYYYAFGAIDNLQAIFSYAQSWVLQPFFSTAIAVDSFFVMSGFLLSYLFFEGQKRRPTKNYALTFFKTLANRYIRLTPCFMIVMFLACTISIFLNDTSQYWQVENIEENCRKYWWRNLLYIQNFYPLNEMCLSWSWYVSTDFQLFALCSVLLILYLINKKACVVSSILIFLASTAYSAKIGYSNNFGFSLDSQFKSIDVLYIVPFPRVGPYFAGFWTGWYLSKIDRKWEIGKNVIKIGWAVTFSLTTFIVFIQYYKEPNPIIGMLFAGFGRSLWAIAICFMIVASSTGKTGFFQKVLNGKCLIPLSRLSYSTYLLNPLLILIISMSSEASFHLDFYSIAISTVGYVMSTYMVAYLFMLLFENPILMFIKKFIE